MNIKGSRAQLLLREMPIKCEKAQAQDGTNVGLLLM